MSEYKDYIKNHAISWFGTANEYDCKTFQKLTTVDISTLRKNFQFSNDEEVLFMRDTSFWNNKNQGAVITDKGIHVIFDNNTPSDGFIIEWNEFNHVYYQDRTFYFFLDDNQIASLPYNIILKCDDDQVNNIYMEVCETFEHFATLAEPSWNPLDVMDFANEKNFEDAKIVADKVLERYPNDPYSYYAIGYTFQFEQECTEITREGIENAKDWYYKGLEFVGDNDHGARGIILKGIAECYELLGQNYNARNTYINVLECDTSTEEILNKIKDCEEKLQDIWESYTDTYEYSERKFCMILRDHEIAGCNVNGIDVFRQSNVPNVLQFPIGHPYPRQLYIGHPYKKNIYVPYENSEEIFFLDKVHELCFLLECLGAEEIKITSIRGKEIDQISTNSKNISAAGDIKLFSGLGNYERNEYSGAGSINKQAHSYFIKLDPLNKPYLPDNLTWYDSQPQWHRLVERRLKSNILEYSESIKSSETRFTSSSEIEDIKASAQYLWTKVNGNVENSTTSQFKESVETEWNISVIFRSLKDFQNKEKDLFASTQYSENELAYIEELKFCLEDGGSITPKEERLLNKMREKLGISKNRAQELFQCVTPSLSKDEQEYAEEVRICLETDGAISPSEMRLLERLRKSLNISEARGAEIRNSIL